MAVAAQKRELVLSAECGNPKIVRWNRLPTMSQFNVDGCVMRGSLLSDVQNGAVVDQAVEPPAISGFVSGLDDAVAILPDNDHRECHQLCGRQNLDDRSVFLSRG